MQAEKVSLRFWIEGAEKLRWTSNSDCNPQGSSSAQVFMQVIRQDKTQIFNCIRDVILEGTAFHNHDKLHLTKFALLYS